MTDILFDEEEIVKLILENGFSGDRANKYELILLGKHYKWTMEYGRIRIKKSIINFCSIHDPNFNPVIARNFLNDVVNIATNNTFKKPLPIQITSAELKTIRNVKDFDKQKILFAFLAIAKSLKFSQTDISGRSSRRKRIGYNVALGLITRVKKTIGLSRTTDKDIMFIFHDLYNLGLVEPTKYYNSINILYADDSGIPVMTVENFSELGKIYEEHCGGELLYCSNCGKEFVKRGNKKDLCKECNKEKIKKQTRERVAKHRRQRLQK